MSFVNDGKMLNQKVSVISEALLFREILLLFSSSAANTTSKKLEESGPRARPRTVSDHAVHPRVGEAGSGFAPIGSGAVGASGQHTSGCVLEVLRDLEAIQVRFVCCFCCFCCCCCALLLSGKVAIW